MVCGKYALEAERISKRFGSPQDSFVWNAPSHGLGPSHAPRALFDSDRSLCQTAFGLAAVAANLDFLQIPCCASFVYEELAALKATVGRSVVNKLIPVDIGDVARSAGAHEAHRNDGPSLLVTIDVFAFGQSLPVYQAGGSDASRHHWLPLLAR